MTRPESVGQRVEVVQLRPLLLSVATVTELLEISRATLLRMVSTGEFPRPMHIGIGGTRRHPRWRRTDVEEWVDKRARQEGVDSADRTG